MLLGYFLEIAFADVYMLSDADSPMNTPTSYNRKEDIPSYLLNTYVTQVMAPHSNNWFDGRGVLIITYKSKNF